MKNTLKTSLLALAGMGVMAHVGYAGNATVTYTDGDLLLGFQNSDSTNDYLLDVGPETNYTKTAKFTLNTTVPGFGNIASDLSSSGPNGLFGSGWYSSSTLFAVIGANNGDATDDDTTTPVDTLYTSKPSATSFNEKSSNTQSGVASTVATIGNNGYTGNTSTSNSNLGIIQADSNATSFAAYQPGGVSDSSGSLNYFTPSNEGPVTSTLYLDQLQPHSGTNTAGTVLGTFAIDSAGDVTYTGASAVPEPSTWASLAIATGAFFMMAKRRLGLLKA